jgi:hypothetical protein
MESTRKPWFTWQHRWGRYQAGITIHHHVYPGTLDRWVFRPWFIWDRKEKT